MREKKKKAEIRKHLLSTDIDDTFYFTKFITCNKIYFLSIIILISIGKLIAINIGK